MFIRNDNLTLKGFNNMIKELLKIHTINTTEKDMYKRIKKTENIINNVIQKTDGDCDNFLFALHTMNLEGCKPFFLIPNNK